MSFHRPPRAIALLARGLGVHLVEERRLRAMAEEALARIRILKDMLPIDAPCKKVHDDEGGSWTPFDDYLLHRADVRVSHGLCPECARRLYPDTGEGR